MNVKKTVSAERMELALEGKLDSVSAPKFEAEISGKLKGITDLAVDLGEVEYVSSAGLRALLFLQQRMEDVGGKMTVRNVPKIVMKIFEVTGFTDIITVI